MRRLFLDESCGLVHQGKNFNGSGVLSRDHWSRGNGWGLLALAEVMTMAAVKRGCRGAIVDGGVRDTDRVLPQNSPVSVKYRSSNGMLGRFRISDWMIPIRIGGVDIYPGDVVFGDIDGVIVVPRAMAFDVLVRAEEIAASEGQLKKWFEEGLPATEIVRRGGYF